MNDVLLNSPDQGCGNCRFWKENTPQHLCEWGKCYLNPLQPKARNRLFYCSEFNSINGVEDE